MCPKNSAKKKKKVIIKAGRHEGIKNHLIRHGKPRDHFWIEGLGGTVNMLKKYNMAVILSYT